MLRGEFQYALDEKGRVVLPPRFRRVLGDQVIVTRGIDPCIAVYSPAEWAKVEEALKRLSTSKRDVTRFLLAGAVDLDLDRQGRITLPPHLRQHAGIEREVVVVGLISRVEIWSRATWQTYLEQAQKSAPKIAEQIEELSI
ncbi:MAG: division/cell wall cluster transcriptional repressor MraZ [Armatimonadota bacterium]|nr:division/cell wall cluster transcriptional repressor MraZ [Armatimonadota bacterium]MDR7536005.1 division/cell wall cluster transcriptional repressor MraZ [Armatimonadota bacterium]